MLRFLLRAPLLSAALFVLWLLLARSTSAGHVALAIVLALGIPILTTKLRPKARVRRPLLIATYVVHVIHDVLASSFAVLRGVLTMRRSPAVSKFVIIPIDLRDPAALAVLAMVTTVVPGTVWSELALDRTKLMLHVWDVPDERAFIEFYKARYEQPLREIFE